MGGYGLPVAIVRACLREGAGGSPTAVLDDAPLSDAERRRVPALTGASHAVFVSVRGGRPGRPSGADSVSLRFFTAAGELPGCGHGTVAALAFLAERAGGREYRAGLHAGGRAFTGWCTREGSRFTAAFEAGPVELREPTASECALVLPALGLAPALRAAGVRVASVGRPRLLVPVASRSALASLAPDVDRLREGCDRLGLLGAYVHTPPVPGGRGRVDVSARMFAPSIGVPEDIANANSTACLAAHLAGRGVTALAVHMGDSLGSPATITATVTDAPGGGGGRPLIRLGGAALVAHRTSCALP
ncbi:PhzF family phenazine biosynthesis protein [Streptomyces sp. V4-01]|uniref:PhzF family phenazine biosynthesis protein n=1 Tax=Actinacidiphila polyblastidii TaxID=3110430 RepID=A0ABU7P4M6_9ACTN|nr:PhzF family phenazine biosynthesis protein [Streptomyces sp. V4-01]